MGAPTGCPRGGQWWDPCSRRSGAAPARRQVVGWADAVGPPLVHPTTGGMAALALRGRPHARAPAASRRPRRRARAAPRPARASHRATRHPPRPCAGAGGWPASTTGWRWRPTAGSPGPPARSTERVAGQTVEALATAPPLSVAPAAGADRMTVTLLRDDSTSTSAAQGGDPLSTTARALLDDVQLRPEPAHRLPLRPPHERADGVPLVAARRPGASPMGRPASVAAGLGARGHRDGVEAVEHGRAVRAVPAIQVLGGGDGSLASRRVAAPSR